MRRLLLSCLLVCALASIAMAGPPEHPSIEGATHTDSSGVVWTFLSGVWELFTG